MKEIRCFLIIWMCALSPIYAATMCVRANTAMITSRKDVNGTVINVTNGLINGTQKKQWAVKYDDKTVTGYAACNEISGTYGVPVTNLDTDARNNGQYCWCKMWPILDRDDYDNYNHETGITSYWVFLHDYSSAEKCASSCTSACANAMAMDVNFRNAVYESIW